MRHTSTDPPWGVIFLVVKRFPVVGDRSRSFGSRDYGGWIKPVDQLSKIAANPPASPLAQLRERNKITCSPRYGGKSSKEHQEGRDLGPFEPAKTRGNLAMLATWIETAAKGRSAGPIRAGMWSAAVVGTHPVEHNQR